MQAEIELNRPAASPPELARVEASGVRFLLDQQEPDGAWRDFLIAPGRSDAWVTAYAGAALLTHVSRYPEAVPAAVASAARFLVHARKRSGGWSYNSACDHDADSTARVLLFLRSAHQNIDLHDYAVLAGFQLEDGAFATFHYKNGWGSAHPDVTAVALLALASVLPSEHIILRKGYHRLRQFLLAKCPWKSYWWPSRFYLIREVQNLHNNFHEAPKYSVQPRLLPNAGVFEQALALEAALLSGVDASRMKKRVQRLVAMQCTDGGWPAVPILRLTNPDARSSRDRLGQLSPLVPDDRRIFTTATVLRALSLYRRAAHRSSPKFHPDKVREGF
ncbi:MAG: prenyltransferase/squalene oxidase repeat-containing protein [Terracidiphilus sp.]